MTASADQPDQDSHHWSAICDAVLSMHREVSSTVHRCVIAVAGSVAVGKSTFSSELADRLLGPEMCNRPTVVGTDAYLFPNHVLALRGLEYDKGLPETYDWVALRAFVDSCRAGETPIEVPVYSHVAFNIVGTQLLAPNSMVIVEGINAMQSPIADAFDLRLYLDAPYDVIASWYVTRFLEFIEAAESDPSSFYTRFVGLPADERHAMAQSVWDSINLPNLEKNIQPSMENADVIVTLDSRHRIVNLIDHRHVP